MDNPRGRGYVRPDLSPLMRFGLNLPQDEINEREMDEKVEKLLMASPSHGQALREQDFGSYYLDLVELLGSTRAAKSHVFDQMAEMDKR